MLPEYLLSSRILLSILSIVIFNAGWTGGGKNYVTRMIVHNTFSKGVKSSFMHVFNSEILFKHASKVDLYKVQVQTANINNIY